MNFLDESGLKKLWAKIKASFGTAIVTNSSYSDNKDDEGRINIPFVANHQVVIMDAASNINVYDWFKDAPKGGILEIAFFGTPSGYTYCSHNNENFMMKMENLNGPRPLNIIVLKMQFNTYARLVKTKEKLLLVAEFVENKRAL